MSALASRPDIALFHGRLGPSPAEQLVEAARRAAALDVLDRLVATGRFGRRLVVTDDPLLQAALATSAVTLEPSGAAFHFGRRLAALATAYGCRDLLYLGAGSGPLTPTEEWLALIDSLAGGSACCANNFLSADYVAFTPAAEALARIQPPETDNDLSWRLVHAAGLTKVTRPRSIGGEVDIDTPTDVALLTLVADLLSPRLSAVAQTASAIIPGFDRVLTALANPEARLLVTGRINATAWSQLERATMRYTRLVSEERGMRASGRLARGEIRSLLGLMLEAVGPVRFFEALTELCDVALIDTRVLFAHLRRDPSAADRFASDCLSASVIADPVVRAFTEAAAQAPIPVLLGGHSLVSGGLWIVAHYLQQRRSSG